MGNTSEQLQSKVISLLRFPLIVGVVLIHTQINTINNIEGDPSAAYPFDGAFPLYESVFYLFAQILTRVSVPLFFMFSGFLFFYKTKEFTFHVYISKIKKRVRTLLVPYLFWNILFIVFYNLVGFLLPGATESIIGEGYAFNDWLALLWDRDNTTYPISYQFWFIRDLMVVVLFTPFIYWLNKKLDYLLSLFLGLLWMAGWWFNVVGPGIDALFFFTLGAYFSISNKSFVDVVKPYYVFLITLYFVLVITTFTVKSFDWVVYFKRLSIMVGAACTIAWSAKYIERGKWTVNKYLSESSFFVYAYHIIALPIIRRVLFFVIPCTTSIRATILYFLWATITVIVGLALYYFSKKLLPRTIAFVTGGR